MSKANAIVNEGGTERDLTRNQQLVYRELIAAEGPMSAYDLLDQLREHGLRAPLQVYRALDKLLSSELVHRVETLNAFVACTHPADDAHGASAFAICDSCSSVTELAAVKLERQLRSLARGEGFSLTSCAIELRGTCSQCKIAVDDDTV